MERDRRAAIATFYVDAGAPFVPGTSLTPNDELANHLRARRLADGAAVNLTDGCGSLASATMHASGRRDFQFEILEVARVERPPAIHLRPPIADRDRMLWLGEKATELGIASWEAVRFHRSMSVTPRGEGPGFASRLRARMISALEQSGSAWLPAVGPDLDVESLGEEPPLRVVLDWNGPPLLTVVTPPAPDGVILLVGPEGGIEADELSRLERAGWRRAQLGASTLRFETAAVAAIAVVRAAQLSQET